MEQFERLKGFQPVNPTSKSCARRYQSPSNHPAAARVRAAIGTGRRVREASDPSAEVDYASARVELCTK